ncbi:hypothetical protein U2F10_22000 [Leptothoe sp. EHU-05/26/07-4]
MHKQYGRKPPNALFIALLGLVMYFLQSKPVQAFGVLEADERLLTIEQRVMRIRQEVLKSVDAKSSYAKMNNEQDILHTLNRGTQTSQTDWKDWKDWNDWNDWNDWKNDWNDWNDWKNDGNDMQQTS